MFCDNAMKKVNDLNTSINSGEAMHTIARDPPQPR